MKKTNIVSFGFKIFLFIFGIGFIVSKILGNSAEAGYVPPPYGNPTWWGGNTCDNGGGHNSGSTLNGTWSGIQNCTGGNGYSSLFGGQWPNGIQEWQCVELAFRYVNAAFQQSVYSLGSNYPGGKDFVNDFPQGQAQGFYKYNNGAVGNAPQIGDVISLNGITDIHNPYYNPSGHVAIISASNVDGNGTGTITLFQQNTPQYNEPFTITSWVVQQHVGFGTVENWLHYSPPPTPPPTPTPTVPPTKVGLTGVGINSTNGASQAFKVDAGGIMTTNWQYGAEGNWHGWTDTAQYYRQYQAPPTIIQNQPGGLQGFALGKDGYIYTAYEQTVGDSSTWNTWTATSTSNQFISPPTVSSQSNGFLDVFSVGSDGHPYHKFQNTDGSWSSWVPVAGNTPSLRGSISAVQYPNGNGLQAFARGTDNTIYTSWEVSASNDASWTNWTPISSGNFAGDPVAYNQAYGQMDVFALDTSGHLEHYYQNANNGNNWTGWTTLASAAFVGDPAIAQYPGGKGLQVYIRGGDKTIYTIYEMSANDDSKWSTLAQFAPDSPNNYIQSVGTDPVVINQTNGNMDLFDRSLDNNNSVWHTFQNAANGNKWSQWTQVSSGSNVGKMGYRGVGINIDGSIQAFKRDSSNYMESNYQIGAEGAWHGWNYTSPSTLAFATDPTVVQYVGGGLAAFARGADNTIYTSQQIAAGDSASWNAWTQLGTQTFAGTPIAVNQSNGYIDVFARGTDNEIWHNYQDANNSGVWHGWVVVMAGGFTGDPSVVQYQGDTLQAFARASGSNAIYTTWENSSADDSSWTAFTLIDSTPFSSDPYASIQANGYLDVAAKDMSGNIYHNYYANGRSWHGWVGIAAGGFGGLPAMIQNASGNLQLFEKGADAHLYTNSQTNSFDDSTWNANAFSQLSSGSFSTDPIAIEQMNGYLDVYMKDTNGNWWHMFQDGSGNWSGGYNF